MAGGVVQVVENLPESNPSTAKIKQNKHCVNIKHRLMLKSTRCFNREFSILDFENRNKCYIHADQTKRNAIFTTLLYLALGFRSTNKGSPAFYF
jgi:hypothetical protein